MPKVIVKEEELPMPGVRIGEYDYYTTAQIAAAIGIPEYNIVKKIRDPNSGIGGQRIGAVNLVDAKQFNEWVRNGKLDYTPRIRVIKERDEDIADAERKEAKRLSLQG